jgi:hypothetical protein
MHGFFTFRSRETFSTIGRVSTITSPAPTPAIPVPPSAPAPALLSFSLAWILFANSPHSFNAKAASSTLRFVARAISERVHRTLTCVSALPSSSIVVVNVRMLENWGSVTYRTIQQRYMHGRITYPPQILAGSRPHFHR